MVIMVIYGHIWSLSPKIRNLLKEKRRNASHLDLLAPQQVKDYLDSTSPLPWARFPKVLCNAMYCDL